jgi:hypothetical protein
MAPRNPANASDHDLLIRIDTKVDVLQSTVAETRTALSARIDRLAQEKASYGDLDVVRKSIEDYQKRNSEELSAKNAEVEKLADKVDWTRRMIWVAIGILGTLQFLGPAIIFGLFRKN